MPTHGSSRGPSPILYCSGQKGTERVPEGSGILPGNGVADLPSLFRASCIIHQPIKPEQMPRAKMLRVRGAIGSLVCVSVSLTSVPTSTRDLIETFFSFLFRPFFAPVSFGSSRRTVFDLHRRWPFCKTKLYILGAN